MKTKQKIKEWLLENAVNRCGNIDLSGIDFGELDVDFSGVKANNYIDNTNQKANDIYNYNQKANEIYNKTNAIINGKEYKVDLTDDYYLMVEKETTRNGLTIIEGFNLSGKKIWLYKNSFIGYHATTKQKAKEGFKRKLKGFERNQELIDEIKETQIITREQYSQLTGACRPGIQAFAERVGKPNNDSITLQELKDLLTEKDYGYNMIMKWLGE